MTTGDGGGPVDLGLPRLLSNVFVKQHATDHRLDVGIRNRLARHVDMPDLPEHPGLSVLRPIMNPSWYVICPGFEALSTSWLLIGIVFITVTF